MTYYLRTEFEFDKEPAGSELSIDHVLDDGVRYFLNGKELARVRLPDGEIDSNTVATKVPTEGVVEEDAVTASGSAFLVEGTNVLAAEVHNDSAGSSDVVFGARLNIAAHPKTNEVKDFASIIHPWLRRDLPTGDFSLNTRVELMGIEFGDFSSGLIVESAAGNQKSRYLFGYENGNELAVKSINPSGRGQHSLQ